METVGSVLKSVGKSVKGMFADEGI